MPPKAKFTKAEIIEAALNIGYCKVAYEKQEPKKSAPLEP